MAWFATLPTSATASARSACITLRNAVICRWSCRKDPIIVFGVRRSKITLWSPRYFSNESWTRAGVSECSSTLRAFTSTLVQQTFRKPCRKHKITLDVTRAFIIRGNLWNRTVRLKNTSRCCITKINVNKVLNKSEHNTLY